MESVLGNPHLSGCIFSDNTCVDVGYGAYGGGMANIASSATLIDCTFFGNSAFFSVEAIKSRLGTPIG